ncbi:MAG: glycosyltransferase family 4 protein [bacterium]
MDKLLYIKHADSSFVVSDQKILEQTYRIIPFLLNQPRGGIYFLGRLVLMCCFIVWNSWHTKAFVTWFGDYHSAIITFLGKLLRIKVVIIAGGQESICYPELRKGVYLKPVRGRFVKYALRNCTLIIPNHTSLIFHDNLYYRPEGKKDGFKYYIPNLKTRIEVVSNGIDTGKFFRAPHIPKNEKLILTVGTMSTIYDFINKGFDLFVQLAQRNPQLSFTLIGIKKYFLPWAENEYQISRISNLAVIPSFYPDELLVENYNRAKVFIQASITEGMPNTLNEAMLCGCIPIGSNVNGIPDAIGKTGVIIHHREIGELEAGMYKALSMNTEKEAIRHAKTNFSLELREERMKDIFNKLIS